jgi:GT2 family glycosyltransferase
MSGPLSSDDVNRPEQLGDEPVIAVIPTCHRPDLIQGALRSVANQVRRPDHLVVVDVDAASWSAVAAAKFATDHGVPTTYVTAPEGTRTGAARNIGGHRTQEGWLAFLDDDDSWDPEYLAAGIALADAATDLVATRIRLRHKDRVDPLPCLPSHLAAGDFLIRNPGVTGSSLLIRASAFHRIGGFDPELAAYNDLDLMIRALDAGLTTRVNQQPLVEQLIHSHGQATSPSVERLSALAAFAERYEARMSGPQRRLLRRERHRINKRLAPTRAGRLGHLICDVALSPGSDLIDRALRARRLGGRYG